MLTHRHFSGTLAARLADAFMKRNQKDQTEVIKHYVSKGLTREQVLAKPRWWWKQHCRYSIPPPGELGKHVQKVIDDLQVCI